MPDDMNEDDRLPGVTAEVTAPSATPGEGLPQAAPPPWGAWDLGLFLAFFLFAFLVFPVLGLAVYAALRPIGGWRASVNDLAGNPLFMVAAQSISYVLLLAYVYTLVVIKYRLRFWTGLKWRPPTAREAFQFALGGVLLGFLIARAPHLLPDREDFPLERLFSSPGAAYALAFFAIVVAPFMEEVIFRGVLFAFFERLAGLRFAISGTALLFAGLHVPEYWGAWNHALLILVVAAALSLARALTGSLAPSVILHLAYNASMMAALFFASQHFHSIR
jgi:membrane protease YdiL (CAAX protease family)